MNNRNKKSSKDKRGFTLAELLVVVAILAILVAVSIPILTGRLEAAREATCKANRKTVKDHMVVDYMSHTLNSENPNELLNKYVELDKAVCPSDGEFYISGNGSFEDGFTIRCFFHDNGNELSGESIAAGISSLWNGLSDSTDLKNYFATNGSRTIDSGANTDRTKEIIKLLQKNGLTTKALRAETWALRSTGKNAKGVFYWSSIGNLDKNAEGVPFLKYDLNTESYSVWSCDMEGGYYQVNGGNYAAFSKQVKSLSSSEKQTYEEALKDYEKALEEYNKN